MIQGLDSCKTIDKTVKKYSQIIYANAFNKLLNLSKQCSTKTTNQIRERMSLQVSNDQSKERQNNQPF